MLIQLYYWPLDTIQKEATTQEELLMALREMRDVLLKESDWTQRPDCPLSEEIKNDWRIWRQEMRDITSLVSLPLENTLQLPIPPATGRPSSWDNWDLSAGATPWGVPHHHEEEDEE